MQFWLFSMLVVLTSCKERTESNLLDLFNDLSTYAGHFKLTNNFQGESPDSLEISVKSLVNNKTAKVGDRLSIRGNSVVISKLGWNIHQLKGTLTATADDESEMEISFIDELFEIKVKESKTRFFYILTGTKGHSTVKYKAKDSDIFTQISTSKIDNTVITTTDTKSDAGVKTLRTSLFKKPWGIQFSQTVQTNYTKLKDYQRQGWGEDQTYPAPNRWLFI